MLQLSMDWLNLEDALKLLQQLEPYVDIAEVGTPMLFEYGLDAVRQVKEAFPRLTVLADMKIMDAGSEEAAMAIRKGADIVTAMAAAKDATILGAAQVSHDAGKKIMVDLLGVSDINRRAKELDEMGIDYLCLHTAFDMKLSEQRPVKDLQQILKFVAREKTAIAGGITLKELPAIIELAPQIVIVGGGILDQADIPSATQLFHTQCGGKNMKEKAK